MRRVLVGLVALSALMLAGVHFSGASFQGASVNPANAFAAATQFYVYAVEMGDPGTPISATVSLTATTSGTDAGSVTSVRIERSPAGAGTWTTVCTDPVAPYSCPLDTTTLTDGLYDFRAVATDPANDARTSSIVANRRVDNTAPSTVTLSDPGSTTISGSKTFSGSAADAGSGVASWTLQYSPAGADTWSDGCTATTSPYSCSYDTSALGDGLYDFRALAADDAGHTATSAPRTDKRVDNVDPTVSTADPGAFLRATVTLEAAAADGGGIASVTIQYTAAGLSTWTNVCTDTTFPYSCDWVTTGATDGLYDLRAVAVDNGGLTATSTIVTNRRVDNAAPSATLTNPGNGPYSGTMTFSGTASDSGSGVQTWTVQYAPEGTSSWSDACSSSTAPHSCSLETTMLADGSYDWRAVALDTAGNVGASGAHTERRVDNTPPTVTLSDPGALVHGTISFTATASDPGGGTIAQVVFQRSAAGASSWTTMCTDATSPYTCSYTTASQPDGPYDFRAVATDGSGFSGTSTVVGSRQVDNTAPTGVDVQTANVAGGTAGQVEAGDSITFTWSEPLAAASVMAGWDGTAASVTVRLTNRNLNQGGDRLDVYDGANTAKLTITGASLVSLGGDYVPNSGAVFAGTIVRSGSAITVTVGALQSGGVQALPALPGTIAWAVSSGSTDPVGNATTASTVSESGLLDAEF